MNVPLQHYNIEYVHFAHEIGSNQFGVFEIHSSG
jgi:hypothetical protein